MDRVDLTGSLMFFTLGAVAIVAIVALLWFLRKPKNRHPLPDDHPIVPPASTSGPAHQAGQRDR